MRLDVQLYPGIGRLKQVAYSADTEDQHPSERISPELLNGYRRNTQVSRERITILG
jgi:hypothetical protein